MIETEREKKQQQEASFSIAVGLVHLHDAEGRRVKFCVGEDSCNSQTMTKGSESMLLVATLRSIFVPQTKR